MPSKGIIGIPEKTRRREIEPLIAKPLNFGAKTDFTRFGLPVRFRAGPSSLFLVRLFFKLLGNWLLDQAIYIRLLL